MAVVETCLQKIEKDLCFLTCMGCFLFFGLFFFFLFFALNTRDPHLLTFNIRTGFLSDPLFVVKSDGFRLSSDSAAKRLEFSEYC